MGKPLFPLLPLSSSTKTAEELRSLEGWTEEDWSPHPLSLPPHPRCMQSLPFLYFPLATPPILPSSPSLARGLDPPSPVLRWWLQVPQGKEERGVR